MADAKISALTADTSPTSDDLIPTVNDPAGTPANRKVTAANLITKAHGLSDSTVVGVASGVLTSGTDVAVVDGGTGASTASGARTNLGLVIGTDVQAFDADLTTLSTSFTSASASGPASLDFHEDTDNGTNKITIQGVSSVASDKVLTLPDATDTLVGKATTDTFTNKTFDADGTGNSITNIENADIKAAAAIALNKLAATTASRALVSDASGFVSAATTTSTEIGYVNGVTSSIQTQLDAKQPLDSDLTTIAGLTATTNNFIQSASSAWASRTPTQVTATLDAMVGDSGSGGTKGLVPAPASGDAAAGKFLKADGTWTAPTGGSGDVATDAIWDAKGDLAVGTGANTASRLAVGTDGQVLTADSAQATGVKWSTPAGGGDVVKVGTPVNNQVGVWTGDGTLEGDTALTFDTTTDTLSVAASGKIAMGAVNIIDDSAGTTTLSNIDALDTATESTIENAIDTLANLTSIQGRTVTLADAGANAVFGWDDTAGAYENLSQAEVLAVIGDSSTTAKGVVEIATAAETTTGTDAARAVSPDGLAGSDYGKRVVQVALNGSTALTTSDKGYFRVPAVMNGYNLVAVAAMVQTASSSGTPTFTVKRGTTSMLTTNLTIDASETDSSTAATAAVIDTANDDVSTGQQIEVACSVAGTGTLWAVVELTFQLP